MMKQSYRACIIIATFLLLSLLCSQAALTKATPTWSIQNVDSAGDVGYWASIAVDSSGNPHISYYDWNNDALKYARWTGSAWNIQTVESGSGAMHSSLAVDSSGNPHISYVDRTIIPSENAVFNLRYARWTGSAWNIQTVESGAAGIMDISLALDSGGNPHISYFYIPLVVGDGNLKYAGDGNLRYARWAGSAWNIQTVDSGAGGVGNYASLAVDSSGNPHIIYYGHVLGGLDLRYARWTGSAWNIQILESTIINNGDFTSIAVDSSGNPHIIYYCITSFRSISGLDLRYARWAGSAWNIQTVDLWMGAGEFISSITSASLALDSGGNPHIGYCDAGVVKYANWNGSAWNIQTVDSGSGGMYSSLALDSSGNPHISYYGSISDYGTTGGNLKYAVLATTTVTATIDSGATVDLAISGNIRSSQMSNVTIATNQSATSTTVSFTVTGESGATGFGNVTIPKSAVPYGTTSTIYIDGQPAQDQGYTQDANNYYVWYTIHFSTHEVSIVFTAASSSSLPLEAIYGVAVAVAIVAIVAVVLVLRKSKKGKS